MTGKTATVAPAMLLAGGLLVALLAACSKPQAPDKEQQPEPQAEAAADGEATEMRDAIQAPINRARDAEQALQDAAQAQREAIDAAAD